MNNYYPFVRVLATMMIAMALRIVPWPYYVAVFNPDWVLLTLIYWTLAIPERVGIFHAWLIGLLTDVLVGRSFGQHALAYSIISYICISLYKRLRPFPLRQQGLFIFLFLLLSQLLLFWIKSMQNPDQVSVLFWLPVLTGTLCWPIVYKVLRFIRLLPTGK
jgi:rod shape-determining protein MreD